MSVARCLGPSVAPSAFAGFRFPPEVITLAVRWYLRPADLGQASRTETPQSPHTHIRISDRLPTHPRRPAHIPAITLISLGTGFAAPERIRGAVIDTFAAMISGSPVCWTSPSIGTNPAHDTRLSSSKRAKSVENLCDTRTGSAFLEPGRSVPRNTYHSSSEGTLLIHTPLNQHRTSTDPGPKKLRRLAGLRTQVEQAMGRQALAHLRTLNTAVTNIAHLEDALGEAFAQHPDAAIITSFPALGTVLGARILGEIGDDRTRFANAKVLKA